MKSISSQEKHLALTLLILIVLGGAFFQWTKNRKSSFLATPRPVYNAQFVDENHLFVVLRDTHKSQTRKWPEVALYKMDSGEKLWARSTKDRVVYSNQISPDGQWLLTKVSVPQKAVLLSRTKTGEIVQMLPSGSPTWHDEKHFSIARLPRNQSWVIEKGRAILQQTVQKLSRFSPDKKLAVQIKHDGPLPKPFSPKKDYPLAHYEIVSASDGKTLHKLPGDNWRAFFWPNNSELRGAVVLHNGPPRVDILHYDLKTQKISSTQLDTSDKNLRSFSPSYMDFKFSPDGHWLAAGIRDNRFVWDTRTGKLIANIATPMSDDGYVAGDEPFFSPDSRILLIPTRDGVRFHHLPMQSD